VCFRVGQLAHIGSGVSSVLPNVKFTIPAFCVCTVDGWYGKHVWTVLNCLQFLVLVMNFCHTPHLLELVTNGALSCSHMYAAECCCAWVVMVGKLMPVLCRVSPEECQSNETWNQLLESNLHCFWLGGNYLLKEQKLEMKPQHTSTFHKAGECHGCRNMQVYFLQKS
jgi:L-lactate permease